MASNTPEHVAPGTEDTVCHRWLARFGVDMRPGEGLPASLLFLSFFLLIAFQYAAKSVRQSTFISDLGASKLPYVYLLVALSSYPILRLYGRVADRIRSHQLIAGTSTAVAVSMAGFWWLYQFPWRWVPVLFYIWLSVAIVMVVSQFWSFTNLVLDPRQAKRLFGFIGAGGLLGGIAGGQVARFATQLVGTRYSLLVAAVLLLGVVGLIFWVNRLRPVQQDVIQGAAGLSKLDKAKGGFDALRDSRHLRLIAALMLLTVMVAQVVDLQFNWAVEQVTTTLDQRTQFFGNFFTIMGISAFVFQLLFTARIHRLLGVGFAMRVLPVTMALGTGALFGAGALIVVFPSALIGAALVLKVGENGIRYSLDQATRELLYLPVPKLLRVKAKAFIDVFIQRSAKGLAALLLLPVTFAWFSPVQAGWISFALIVLWLVVTVLLKNEYVRSFRRGLKQRSFDVAVPINLTDPATLELLVQSLGSSDPRQVLHSLDVLESHGRGKLVPPLLLYHDDAEVRHRTLKILARLERKDAAHLVERRVGDLDPEVRVRAIEVLAGFKGQAACELMLTKVADPDPGVRAAAMACLANHGEKEMIAKASEALNDMLSDADPEVRVEATKALGTIEEPLFQTQVIQLLYDDDPDVVHGAIAAVRRRAKRDAFNPLYVPSIISLLNNRRLKHEAREALTALGEPVIPSLVHFMGDPDEQLWVRRAIPKTIANIDAPGTVDALLDALRATDDSFLCRKLVEALASLPTERRTPEDPGKVEAQIDREAKAYYRALTAITVLGFEGKGSFELCRIAWDSDEREPTLLDQLLAGRMADHLANIFGLLTLLYPPDSINASHRSLVSGNPMLRSHALEYLDNTLLGEIKRKVFAVIGDHPLPAKLRAAEEILGTEQHSSTEILRHLLEDGGGSPDSAMTTAAALYTVHTDAVSELHPEVKHLAREGADGFVRETAQWVYDRDIAEASP